MNDVFLALAIAALAAGVVALGMWVLTPALGGY